MDISRSRYHTRRGKSIVIEAGYNASDQVIVLIIVNSIPFYGKLSFKGL